MARIDAKGALRHRTRLTNKTRVQIHHGDLLDAELVLPDEDNEKSKTLNPAGVEKEDASEVHLQNFLATGSNIPTPDANGIVQEYDTKYPPAVWQEPVSYVRFSDGVEDSLLTGLTGGYSYLIDEGDAVWLEKNNKLARGEGSSLSPTPSSRSSTVASRSSKARGKDPELPPPFSITEDEFELIMGLFEKLTDEKCPFLHLDVSGIPPYTEYESFFNNPLPRHFFSGYRVPPSIPPPLQLQRLARAIYPHWCDRKKFRNGHRIIPQLNLDESNEGDPYVCFRRRDVKPVRKTRRSDTGCADRLARLKTELDTATKLANFVLQRERKKKENIIEGRAVFEARMSFADLKRKFPFLSSPHDEELLIDKTMIKRPKPAEPSAVGTIKLPRRPRENVDPISPFTLGYGQETTVNPIEKAALIATTIERDCQRKKERDHGWEEVTDSPYQPLIPANAFRHFRPINVSLDNAPSDPPIRARSFSMRVRTGRGGRHHVDRRFHGRQHPLNQIRGTSESMDEDEQRYQKVAKLWAFNSEASGADEAEDRIIIDDYETRFLRSRISLISDDDLQRILRTDDTFIRRIEAQIETRQEKMNRPLFEARHRPPPPAHRDSSSSLPSTTWPTPLLQPATAPSPHAPQLTLPPSVAAPPPTTPTTPATPNQAAVLAQAQALMNAGQKRMLGQNTPMRPINGVRPYPPVNGQVNHVIPVHNNVSTTNGVTNGVSKFNYPLSQQHAIPPPPETAAPVRVSSPMRPKPSQPQGPMALPQVASMPNGMTNGFNNPSFTGFPAGSNFLPPHIASNNVTSGKNPLVQAQVAAQAGAASNFGSHPNQLNRPNPATPSGPVTQPQHAPFQLPPGITSLAGLSPAILNNINLGLGPTHLPLKLPSNRGGWVTGQRAPTTGADPSTPTTMPVSQPASNPPSTPQPNNHSIGGVAASTDHTSPVNGIRVRSSPSMTQLPLTSPLLQNRASPNPNGLHVSPHAPTPSPRMLPSHPSPHPSHPTLPSPVAPPPQQVVGGPGSHGQGY